MSGTGVITLDPNFNDAGNMATFPVRELNVLLEKIVLSNSSVYQRLYGCYSYMRLTKDLQHKIHSMQGHPLVWQQHKSCKLTPVGVVRMDENTIVPCKAVALVEQCTDELFGSCFRASLDWDGDGPVQLDANGRKLWGMLVDVVMQMFTEGAAATLAAGQLYDLDTVEFEKVSKEIQNAFKATVNTCEGWVKMLQEGADQYPHWNVAGLLNLNDFDSDGCYTGDIIALMDALRKKSTPAMNRIINQGVRTIRGTVVRPLYKLSSGLFNALADAKRAQDAQPLQNDGRITTELADGVMLYFFDGIPVIPVYELGSFEEYIEGCTELAALTISGNINLGASFRAIPNMADGNEVGLMLWSDPEPKNFGNIQMRSDSLFSTAIANSDFIVATQEFVVPA